VSKSRTDKAIKRLPISWIIVMFFTFIVASIVNFVWITPKTDLLNATTLVLEIGFATMITWTVYILSKKWNKENEKITQEVKTITSNLEKLTKEVQKTVNEEATIRDEIRGDVSFILDRKLNMTIRSLEQSKKMYANLLKESDQNQANIWRNNMKQDYDMAYARLNLELGLLELMKIFGASLSRKYWLLLTRLNIHLEMYEYEELSSLNHDVEAYLEDCKKIKEIIKPWISTSRT